MNKISDNRGNIFESAEDFCRWYRIDYDSYLDCVRLGYSIAEIIESIENSFGRCKYHDHLGNGFRTVREMCKFWDISHVVYNTRFNGLGWSLKDALETPLKVDKYATMRSKKWNKPVTDHTGREYNTFDEMCIAWGKDPLLVEGRMRCHGWSLEDALTRKKGQIKPKRKELVERGTFRKRFAHLFGEDGRSIMDHKGQVFPNYLQMCKFYGINSSAFCQRVESGWDLASALETPTRRRKNTVEVNGKVWNTVKEFCDEMNIDVERYFYLKKSGQWDVIEHMAA